MSEVIDNDYHPIDQGLEATNDHWGTTVTKETQVNRSAKGDMPEKNNTRDYGSNRYGGGDLPMSKKGSNERSFYDSRK